MEKLYIRPADMPDMKNICTPEAFIKALYIKKPGEYVPMFPATYSARNFHTKSRTCEYNKARSFGDLLKVANTYFENVTPQQLLRTLYSMIDLSSKGCMLIYCPDVQKIVFHFSSWDRSEKTAEANSYRVLVDYLFYDYAGYVIRNKIEYEDEYDFVTLMGYIGITPERCLQILRNAQEAWIDSTGEGIERSMYSEW